MSKIVSCFFDVAKKHAEEPALIFSTKQGIIATHSFSSLANDSLRYAAYLKQIGVKKGNRVLLFAPVSYEMCVFMLSIMLTGATAVFVDIWAKRDRLKVAVDDAKPNFIAVSHKTAHFKRFFPGINKIKNVIVVDKIPNTPTNFQIPDLPEEQIALATMTTGSSSTPKLVLRSHAELAAQLQLINNNLPDKQGYFITTSFMYIFSNLISGTTTVVPNIKSKYSEQKIERELSIFTNLPIKTMFTTPDFCLKMQNPLPSLKNVYIGGAILNLYETEKILSHFPKVNVHYIYGSTECCLISSTDLITYRKTLKTKKISDLGAIAKGVRAKSNNYEIVVTAHALLKEYLGTSSPDSIDKRGTTWHPTSDAGAIEDSHIIYYGKTSRRIHTKDTKLFASQIEQNICVDFPEITKCALIQKDSNVYVFITTNNKSLAPPLKTYLQQIFNEHITIRFLKQIPTDVKHHTKIDYSKLEKFTK